MKPRKYFIQPFSVFILLFIFTSITSAEEVIVSINPAAAINKAGSETINKTDKSKSEVLNKKDDKTPDNKSNSDTAANKSSSDTAKRPKTESTTEDAPNSTTTSPLPPPESATSSDTTNVNETKKILEQASLIDKTLEVESKEISELSVYLESLRAKKAEFESQTNVYKIELTTFGSQLHLPKIDPKLIEKAYMSSQAAVTKISNDLSKLKEKSEELKQSIQISYDQKMGNDKFLMELQNNSAKSSQEEPVSDKKLSAASDQKAAAQANQPDLEKSADDRQRVALEQKIALEQQQADEQKEALSQLYVRLKSLQTAITKKMLLMQSVYNIINEQIPVLSDLLGNYKTVVSELEITIRDTKTAELLTRKNNPFTYETWKRVGDDAAELISIFKALFEKESWKESFSFLWLSGLHKLIGFIITLLIVLVVAIRLKLFIRKFCTLSPHLENRYWSRMVLEIFGRNLLLSSVTAFLYLCVKFKLFFSYAIASNLIVEILIILIFVLWTIYFLEYIQVKYPATPSKEMILFLKWLNFASVVYILLGASLRIDSSIIIAYRLVCEILFYAWLVYFLKKLMPAMTRYCEQQNETIQMVPTFYKNGVIIAAITGIVLEILGYGTLSFYWYTSWAKTLIVLMWSGLIIAASKEWIVDETEPSDQHTKDISHGHVNITKGFSTFWLIKQVSFITMIFIVIVSLMLSWASSDFVFSWLYTIVTFKFTVGSMTFSISSLAQALMIIIITHFFAKYWRNFFQKNFLGKSGLDHGLQESMTTITVYAIWIFGIFTALIVFGLNTTALTVTFGALSIGIGFGLQNIVSNFISGIILLFERPIQVGDDIDVNGTWATIKKTNVRSTIAQTYDNATIIIPNSELISNRVINWSFKDKRLRRKIKVGVEYGSDIELVKNTLMEIAEKTPRVLKFPAPDVLFEDFADSALMFTLRFWTFTDCFMTVETDIRFRIYKVFKEKEIVIAFPQQDINIRTIPFDFIPVPKLPVTSDS